MQPWEIHCNHQMESRSYYYYQHAESHFSRERDVPGAKWLLVGFLLDGENSGDFWCLCNICFTQIYKQWAPKGSKQVLRPAEGSPENFLSLCKNCLFNSNSQFTHLCLTLMFVKLNTCSALRHEKFNTCISVLNHQRELNLFLICQGYCFYFGLTKVYIQHFCYCSEMGEMGKEKMGGWFS